MDIVWLLTQKSTGAVIYLFSPHFLKYSTGNLSLPELKSSFSEALTGLLENNLPLCLGSVEKVCVLTYSPAADRYNMFW